MFGSCAGLQGTQTRFLLCYAIDFGSSQGASRPRSSLAPNRGESGACCRDAKYFEDGFEESDEEVWVDLTCPVIISPLSTVQVTPASSPEFPQDRAHNGQPACELKADKSEQHLPHACLHIPNARLQVALSSFKTDQPFFELFVDHSQPRQPFRMVFFNPVQVSLPFQS